MHITEVLFKSNVNWSQLELNKNAEVNFLSETILEEVKLPESCKKVMAIILEEGSVSSKEIVARVSCSTRSVRYALKRLLDNEYVEKRPCLKDMRQTLYCANSDRLKGEMLVLRRILLKIL